MPIKNCEICANDFPARLKKIRTCSTICRNRLIAREKEAKHAQTKQCVICENSFPISGRVFDRVTCSKDCAYKLRGQKNNKQIQKNCLTCGKSFPAKLHAEASSNYCNKYCWYHRNDAITKRNCLICGKTFTSPPSQMHVKTCSPKCGYEYLGMRYRTSFFTCKQCGIKQLTPPSHIARRVYCSIECRSVSSEWLTKMRWRIMGDKNPVWKGGVTFTCVSKTGKLYRRQKSENENRRILKRNTQKILATPLWANKTEISRIVFRAKQLTRLTVSPP